MTKTLCELAQDASALNEIERLSQNPRFTCKKCGRRAGKKKRLCKPKSD